MAISSKPNTSGYQIRSVSFPCRSHPIIHKIDDQLAELRQASLPMPSKHAQSVAGLASVYKCVEELLHLPMTQQVFFRYRNEKWVDELLDGSITVLDICDITRGMVSQIKQHARHLLCVIRRRKGDPSNIESSVTNYICFRKKIKKDATRLIGNMKQVCSIVGAFLEADQDDHLVAVIRVVTEVSEMTTSIFESLFVFFSVKPKPSKWSIVSKLMHKGRVACEDHQLENANDNPESLDAALLDLCRNGSGNEVMKKIQMAQIKLEAMEGYIESVENGLDCLFRHLIKTRALLLNIVSH